MLKMKLIVLFLYATLTNTELLQKSIEMIRRHDYPLIAGEERTNSTNFDQEANVIQDTILKVACPKNCSCFVDTVAHCGRAKFAEIPCDIPKYTDGNIRYQNVFSKSLSTLYLSHNNIRAITKNCFAASGSKIETLSFRQNKISRIDTGSFQNLTRLEILDLTGNLLTSLISQNRSDSNHSVSVFSGLSESLKSLLLSDNKIKFITQKCFHGFHSLEVLTLSKNKIRWIAVRAFQNLTNLRVLRLRENPFTPTLISRFSLNLFWFSNRFHELTRDRGIYVISTVSDCKLTESLLRHKLQEEEERIEIMTSLDIGELNLRFVPRGLAKSLKVLYLDRNEISVLRQGDFSELVHLNYLYLSHNKIINISSGVFAGMKNLHFLDLSSSNLHQLSPDSFCGLKYLIFLRLNNNPNLTSLPQKVFRPTRQLRFLYLQNCGLESFPSGPWLFKLYALWMYGNPLLCDCSNVAPVLMRLKYGPSGNFGEKLYLDVYRTTFADMDYWGDQRPEETLCSKPFHFAGRLLKQIHPKELQCSAKKMIEILIHKNMVYPYGTKYSLDELNSEKTRAKDIEQHNRTSTNISSNQALATTVAPEEITETNQTLYEDLMDLFDDFAYYDSIDPAAETMKVYTNIQDTNIQGINIQGINETSPFLQQYDQFTNEINEVISRSSKINEIFESSGQTENFVMTSTNDDVIGNNPSKEDISYHHQMEENTMETTDYSKENVRDVYVYTNEENLEVRNVELPSADPTAVYEEINGNPANFNQTYSDFDDEYDDEYWEEYNKNYYTDNSDDESYPSYDVVGMNVERNGDLNNIDDAPLEESMDQWMEVSELMKFWNLSNSINQSKEDNEYYHGDMMQRYDGDDYGGDDIINHYNLSDTNMTYDAEAEV